MKIKIKKNKKKRGKTQENVMKEIDFCSVICNYYSLPCLRLIEDLFHFLELKTLKTRGRLKKTQE